MDLNGICLNCFSYRGEYDVCPHCGYATGTLPVEAYLLHPGTVLGGRYIIGTVLGVGGFGATYKAYDAKLNAIVAVKEFYPGGLVSRIPGQTNVTVFSGEKQRSYAVQLGRFMDEARNMAKFSGDAHIVNVFDFFEENATAYIVMEYLDGRTLKQYMAEAGGRLAPQEALAYMKALLQALESIHKKGIIHRDISPDNIFILNDGRLKVLDFGAARFTSAEDPNLTQGIVVKQGYAPPEQYRSNMKQGVWTDVYAAGATLYKMLTGITPEESVDRMESDALKRPSQAGANVDIAVDKAVMKAMALKIELRFARAEEMINALDSRTGYDFPEEELKKRKRLRTGIIAAAAVVLLAMGAVIAQQATQNATPTLASAEIAPDTITMAMPESYVDSGVYTALAEAFTKQYPDYTVQVVPYGAEDGKTPALYYASGREQGDAAADLTLLLDSIDADSLYFMKDYDKLYPDRKRMPTAMHVRVFYADTIATAAADIELPVRAEKGDVDELLAEGAGAIEYRGMNELHAVQGAWPGHYAVIPVYDNGSVFGTFEDVWSISADATQNQQKVAMLMLHFLMSEYAQNVLHVQHDGQLPLNKKAFAQYIAINPDFAYMGEAVQKMSISTDIQEG